MKRSVTILTAIIIASFFLTNCGSNTNEVTSTIDSVVTKEIAKPEDEDTRLKQESAEKAINELISNHPITLYGNQFLSRIISISTLNQFSENEANCYVDIDVMYGLKLNFVFKKNIDNKWILTAIETAEKGVMAGPSYDDWLKKYSNSGIVVQ